MEVMRKGMSNEVLGRGGAQLDSVDNSFDKDSGSFFFILLMVNSFEYANQPAKACEL
jgi:hypothetical protein